MLLANLQTIVTDTIVSLISPQAMMHSVLAARMVLHLRVEARLNMGFDNGNAISKSMAFAPRMPTSSRSGDTEDTEPTTEHWHS